MTDIKLVWAVIISLLQLIVQVNEHSPALMFVICYAALAPIAFAGYKFARNYWYFVPRIYRRRLFPPIMCVVAFWCVFFVARHVQHRTVLFWLVASVAVFLSFIYGTVFGVFSSKRAPFCDHMEKKYGRRMEFIMNCWHSAIFHEVNPERHKTKLTRDRVHKYHSKLFERMARDPRKS